MMRPIYRLPGLLVLVLGLAHLAQAHFPILIHDAELSGSDRPVKVTYASGHPFELDLEPVARPARLWWLDRRGKATEVAAELGPTLFRGDTNGAGWQMVFEPPPGDAVVALDSASLTDASQKTVSLCLSGLSAGGRLGRPAR